MNQKYSVSLSNEQRSYLEKIISSGEASARKITRARILLKSDCGEQGANWSYKKIVEALDVSEMLVCDVRRRFAQGGVEKALERKKPERDYHQILDGDAEAHLVALACGDEPEGAARWTLRLLQKEMIRRNYVQAISHETIRQVLRKNELKPWLKDEWCIPSGEDAAFVSAMEDVLDVYKLPYAPEQPVLCMDEMPKQLLLDIREPQPMQQNQPARQDYEYQRNGTADLFIVCEPLQGKRYIKATEQRTSVDWAEFMKYVADELYPDATKILVVLDNLNTHTPASFYKAYPPEEARRLAQRFEFHFTPKHGSWLNIAEIELSALAKQCLNRRIPDIQTLGSETLAWQNRRNSELVKVNWRFTTADARIKLKHLYPKIEP